MGEFVRIQLCNSRLFEDDIVDHGLFKFPGVQAKFAEVDQETKLFSVFFLYSF